MIQQAIKKLEIAIADLMANNAYYNTHIAGKGYQAIFDDRNVQITYEIMVKEYIKLLSIKENDNA